MELLIIIIVVAALIIAQLYLTSGGKSKIGILQSVFEAGKRFKKPLSGKRFFPEDKGNSLYYIRELYIPKNIIKDITWEEVKMDVSRFIFNTDDIITDKKTDEVALRKRKDAIASLYEDLDNTVIREEIEEIQQAINAAEHALKIDEKQGKFIITSKTLVCKKEDKEKIQLIFINNTNPVAEEIERSINTYLLRNKGAVSDFNLIKDIVERNCDALSSEIESVTPMPLYLGLAGTMSGIIVGLGIIGLTSGFTNIQSVVDSLMSEVALAMIASLIGVMSTTYMSWKSRNCNVIIESHKNKFYTWIQTELLPVLSSNTVSTLTLLERNLTRFNESFGNTIQQLDVKLTQVGQTYSQQLELLRLVKELDVNKMATANVKILQALNTSSSNLQSFAEYMDNTTEYLSEVNKLTDQLDSYLARTASLETIAEFYKKQMSEIGLRQDAIKSSVVSVDDTMQKALATLEANAEEGLNGLKKTFVKQQDEMEKLATQQGGALSDKLQKLDVAVDFITRLQSLPSLIQKMESAINSTSRSEVAAINNLSESIRKSSIASRGNYGPSRSSKGVFSTLGGFFKKKSNSDVEDENLEEVTHSQSTQKAKASPAKGQWYEQGRNKPVNK